MNTDLDPRTTAALRRIAATAPANTEAARQWASDLTDGLIAVRPRTSSRRPLLAVAAALVVLAGVAATVVVVGRTRVPTPVASPADELTIQRVTPETREGFVFDRAYAIDGYPVVNLGRVDPPNPQQAYCVWAGDGGGCGSTGYPWAVEIRNATSNAWVVTGVPADAVIVRFTNRNGGVIEQQPLEGIAILPDGTRGPVDNCDCEVAAYGPNGEPLAIQAPT